MTKKEIIHRLLELEIAYNKHGPHIEWKQFVECEECGCLLKKDTAIRGKSRVGIIYANISPTISGPIQIEAGEYVHKVYYCKIHAPKRREK